MIDIAIFIIYFIGVVVAFKRICDDIGLWALCPFVLPVIMVCALCSWITVLCYVIKNHE